MNSNNTSEHNYEHLDSSKPILCNLTPHVEDEQINQSPESELSRSTNASIRFHENSNEEMTNKPAYVRRESSQMDMFLNQFIKPEIKNRSTSSIKKDAIPVPKQRLHRRASKRQITLNLLIIGEPGLGKNTFIQSLVKSNAVKKDDSQNNTDGKERIIGKGLVEKSFNLLKDGQRVCLNLIQVPEYGCGMKSDSTFSNILEYVDATFRNCFKLECSLNRTSSEDRKIHCCLYFISSYGHGLKPLDIAFLKLFQTKFNIIPLISKSDIFTKSELDRFKRNVLKELDDNKINLFDHSNNSDLSDGEIDSVQDMCDDLKNKIPLTIVSSNETTLNSLRKEERIRGYPWGSSKSYDNEISNYNLLENVLLKSHINYFRTITKSVHYENYRVQYILEHVQ